MLAPDGGIGDGHRMSAGGGKRTLIKSGISLGLLLVLLFVAVQWGAYQERKPFATLPPPLNETIPQYFAKAHWYDRWSMKVFQIGWVRKSAVLRTPMMVIWKHAWAEDLQSRLTRTTIDSSLVSSGSNSWAATPVLYKFLQDPDQETALRAAHLLCLIRAEQDPQLVRLLETAPDLHKQMQIFSNWIAPTSLAARISTQSMQYYTAGSETFTLVCLSHCGTAALPVLPAIIKKCSPTSGDVALRTNAIIALGQLGSVAKSALPELTSIVRSANSSVYERFVRAAAVEAIARIAPDDPQTISLLRELLQDRYSLVRVKAAISLWRLKTPAVEILPALDYGLDQKLPSVRVASLQAIAEIGNEAASLREKAKQYLTDPEPTVRDAAIAVMAKLGN